MNSGERLGVGRRHAASSPPSTTICAPFTYDAEVGREEERRARDVVGMREAPQRDARLVGGPLRVDVDPLRARRPRRTRPRPRSATARARRRSRGSGRARARAPSSSSAPRSRASRSRSARARSRSGGSASIDVMLTIEPPSPCSRICAAAARMQRNAPPTFTPMMRLNSSGVMCSSRKFEKTPALLTSTSRRPKRRDGGLHQRARRRPPTAMSHSTAATVPPVGGEPLARRLRAGRRGGRRARPRLPASASRRAQAKPNPCAAPVTSATLPLRSTQRRDELRLRPAPRSRRTGSA